MATQGNIFSQGQTLTRRDALRACCGCVSAVSLTATSTRAAAVPRLFEGCLLTRTGYEQFQAAGADVFTVADGLIARNRHWHTTGDASVDRDLDRALGNVADVFRVNPAFGFYDPIALRNPIGIEQNGMNAFASPENTDIPGTKGTVGFGLDLFRREFNEHDGTGLTVMAIVAHEFGHVLQQDRGYLPSLKSGYPLKSEINADFLAGYFLGTRKKQIPSLEFRRAGELMIRLGGGDHGTGRERLDAAEAGFRVAYIENRPLDDAVQAGLRYVRF